MIVIIKNLNYAYNDLGILIQKNQAVKTERYFLDPEKKIELTFAKGEQRNYFRKAKNNVNNMFSSKDEINYKYSDKHLNEIRKIVYEKKFYDEQINKTITCYKAVEEVYFKNIQMRADIVFYNKDGSILCIIEIYNNHKKSTEDIKKLKKLNTVIYEIAIHDTRRTYILALPTKIENEINSIAKTRNILKKQYSEIEKRIGNGNSKISEIRKEINTIEKEINTIEKQIKNINSEKPSKYEVYRRIRRKYEFKNKERVSDYKRKIREEINLLKEFKSIKSTFKERRRRIKEIENNPFYFYKNYSS